MNKIDSNIKINMPKWVEYIIDELQENNHKAYIVGGCVRDSLLGRTPHDYDITTSAKPKEIVDIFESLGYKIIPTGLKHGTVTVMINNIGYEITTFRIDGDYSDGRHPDKVQFTNDLKEDLSRRDFTINAMAYNSNEGLIDYFGGVMDLRQNILNCVGDAKERFKEDKLRILRAFRFASTYNFEIYRNIIYAIDDDNNISQLSKERIQSEFNKILLSSHPSFWLNVMMDNGLLEQIIPNIEDCYMFNQKNPHHDKYVFDHIMSVVDYTEPILELRLAALFHDIGKPKTFSQDENGIGHFYEHHKKSAKMCEETMKTLRYTNKQIENVRELVYWHMTSCDYNNQKSVKKFIKNVGIDRLDNLFKLKVADICGSKMTYNDFEDIFALKFACKKVLEEQLPMEVKDLDINGNDLIALGYKGKEIGDMLKLLLEKVLAYPELNTKEELLTLINKNEIVKGED